MKNTTIPTLAACTLAIFFTISAMAQQTSETAPKTVAATPDGTVSFKIAVIETTAFHDPERGITNSTRAVKALEREFESHNKELQELQERYRKLTDEINATASVANQKVIQEKRFQAETLKRELKNKAGDVEEVYQKRLQAILDPIGDDLQQAIAIYAKQHGISLVIDLSNAQDFILYVAEPAHITRDFIKEYNQRASSASSPAKLSGN